MVPVFVVASYLPITPLAFPSYNQFPPPGLWLFIYWLPRASRGTSFSIFFLLFIFFSMICIPIDCTFLEAPAVPGLPATCITPSIVLGGEWAGGISDE